VSAEPANQKDTAMKYSGKYLMVILVLSAGCDRQIPILENSSIVGYEVQGTVTDQIGNPVPNVDVFLDYTANLVGADTAPTRRYFVPDPSVPVQTVVVNWSKQVIRVLTPLQSYFGWYQEFWDGKDSTGSVPPSGIYYIEYVVGGAVKFSYNQLVSGGQVATTDTKGQYTIPIQYLPVDSASVPDFSAYDSSYVGNLLISNDVILTFQYPTHIQQVERTLNKGQVTIINIVFH
jgi:hypothetical protein